MLANTRTIGIYALCGCLFFIDIALKLFARSHQDVTRHLLDGFFGFEYFANTGIAFSIPVPAWVAAIITPVLMIIALTTAPKQKTDQSVLATTLILLGALSNFIDRLIWGATIDYIRIATGVFNLADIMIGFGLFLLYRSLKKQPLISTDQP